jgi:hypothetical protein
MQATPEYSWEKFFVAVETLAAGRAPLRERLSSAYWHSLAQLIGSPMPWEDLRQEFDQLREWLQPKLSEEADQSQTSDEDLTAAAKQIVSLFNRICDRRPRREGSQPTSGFQRQVFSTMPRPTPRSE